MTRVSKYGVPRSARFIKVVDKKLQQYAIEHEVNESDIIQEAVECFLFNEDCKARGRRKFKE